jgi:hypothetical protein
MITTLVRRHLSWMREGVVPAMAFEAASHAVDQHSVQCTLDLLGSSAQIEYRARWATSSGRSPPCPRGGGYLEQRKRPYQCLQLLLEKLCVIACASRTFECNLVEIDHGMRVQCVPHVHSESNSWISNERRLQVLQRLSKETWSTTPIPPVLSDAS